MILNMKDLLEVAKNKGFAVPAFNISDYSMFNGIMEICEEENAPVIIAIHPDELRHITSEMVKGIRERIIYSKIPAVIHLDHGASIDQIMKAIQAGFTSVMIDGSLLKYEDNVSICKKACELAHSVNVSVEGELGTIGNTDSVETTAPEDILYTNPGHGIYPKDKIPELRIDILDEIKKRVSIPLVLHGGSSNKDSEIEKAVEHGVNKINISSDIKVAYYNRMREVLKDTSLREPNVIQPPCVEEMKKVALHKIKLFRADNMASFY